MCITDISICSVLSLQVWNGEDSRDEVLVMVVRTGFNTTMGSMVRELVAPTKVFQKEAPFVTVSSHPSLAVTTSRCLSGSCKMGCHLFITLLAHMTFSWECLVLGFAALSPASITTQGLQSPTVAEQLLKGLLLHANTCTLVWQHTHVYD